MTYVLIYMFINLFTLAFLSIFLKKTVNKLFEDGSILFSIIFASIALIPAFYVTFIEEVVKEKKFINRIIGLFMIALFSYYIYSVYNIITILL